MLDPGNALLTCIQRRYAKPHNSYLLALARLFLLQAVEDRLGVNEFTTHCPKEIDPAGRRRGKTDVFEHLAGAHLGHQDPLDFFRKGLQGRLRERPEGNRAEKPSLAALLPGNPYRLQ